jgi:hypothetical protein
MTRVKPDPEGLAGLAHPSEGTNAASAIATERLDVAPDRELFQEEGRRFWPQDQGLGQLGSGLGRGEKCEGFLDHGRTRLARKARR